jgi:hypothetical protein
MDGSTHINAVADELPISTEPTAQPANVRIAIGTDTMPIYNLLLGLYAENAMFRLSKQRALETIRCMTYPEYGKRRGRWGICGVIDGPNGIEASIGMELMTWWYTDDFHLMEDWNFVHPDHRKSNHVNDLIDFAKWAAEQLKVPGQLGIITNDRTAAKVRLYRRRIPQVGAYFMWNMAANTRVGIKEIGETNG